MFNVLRRVLFLPSGVLIAISEGSALVFRDEVVMVLYLLEWVAEKIDLSLLRLLIAVLTVRIVSLSMSVSELIISSFSSFNGLLGWY